VVHNARVNAFKSAGDGAAVENLEKTDTVTVRGAQGASDCR
jgi:hypothetical protein